MPVKRLLVDSRGDAIRTALMDGAVLKEIFVDHKTDGSQLGQIILGTVQNILPSQFAFIDIGQEKNAFMNLSAQTDLKTGQPILVQVQKDEGDPPIYNRIDVYKSVQEAGKCMLLTADLTDGEIEALIEALDLRGLFFIVMLAENDSPERMYDFICETCAKK